MLAWLYTECSYLLIYLEVLKQLFIPDQVDLFFFFFNSLMLNWAKEAEMDILSV